MDHRFVLFAVDTTIVFFVGTGTHVQSAFVGLLLLLSPSQNKFEFQVGGVTERLAGVLKFEACPLSVTSSSTASTEIRSPSCIHDVIKLFCLKLFSQRCRPLLKAAKDTDLRFLDRRGRIHTRSAIPYTNCEIVTGFLNALHQAANKAFGSSVEYVEKSTISGNTCHLRLYQVIGSSSLIQTLFVRCSPIHIL